MVTEQVWLVRIVRAAHAAWRATMAPPQLSVDGSPFLLRRRFSIASPLAPTAVAARISALVEPEELWRLLPGSRPFEGQLDDDVFAEFRIRKIAPYFEGRAIAIRGRLVPASSGTIVTGTIFVLTSRIVSAVCVTFVVGVAFARGFAALGPGRSLAISLASVLFICLLSAGEFACQSRASLLRLTHALV